MLTINNKRTGFTIVELLIVIVVIGILASITIVAFSGVQQRSRDARRVSDLKQVQKSLELFHTTQGRYPTNVGAVTWDETWNNYTNCMTAGTTCGFTPSNFQAIVTKLPNDPQDDPATLSDVDPTYYAGYEGSTPDNYMLRTRLESSTDAALSNDADGGWRTAVDGGCNDPWYCIKYNWPY